MQKISILIITIIVLVLTFSFSEVFSIYHFGDVPTLLATLYLLSIFLIFEYLVISIIYVIRKLIRKEKLGFKKIIGLILLFFALLLILLFLVVVDIDYLNWYMNSSPFYLNIIFRSFEFLLPSIILLVIGYLLMKKKKTK